MIKNLFLPAVSLAACTAWSATPPEIVATPPGDGSRGLIRVSPSEIRHYSGEKKKKNYIVSKDNGKTWSAATAPDTYPANYGGIKRGTEAPAITWLQSMKKFLRVQPIGGFLFMASDLDGAWEAVRKDGKLEPNWAALSAAERSAQLLSLEGIMRNPIEVNGGKRIIIPAHLAQTGAWFYLSDDGGLTWTKSKDLIWVPEPEVVSPNKDVRWYNGGVEPTIVELKDGRLWATVRNSHDQHWESYSSDYGHTWTKPQPSRFFATLTMHTLGRMKDGTLISLWTNAAALPEAKHGVPNKKENAFTNRDSHHIAISMDDGKTWQGFREIYLNPVRADTKYAAGGDLGSHQSEFIELDKNHILVSFGQHARHRRMAIVNLDWVRETSRKSELAKDGATDWTFHTFIPVSVGHCAYNRKHAADVSKTGMLIQFNNDPELVNEKVEADLRKGGATWNFPNGQEGKVTIKFEPHKGSQGMHFSLCDRLFNACDDSAPSQAIFSYELTDKAPLKWDAENTLTMQWRGVEKGKSLCEVTLNGKPLGSPKAINSSPNGISYLHILTAASGDAGADDAGMTIISTEAKVKNAAPKTAASKKKKK